jgi:CPA2 family monovalent cation:H+ antiporter-2
VIHETDLIATVAVGLSLAFVGGLLAARLRLPPIVGYLAAGVAIGPFTPGFVADVELTSQLAEIGVILLMFGVGLHFSPGDLLEVRGIALPGAIGQIAAATAVGIGIGVAWGWGVGGGLVLGLALSVASTVVLLRALGDRDELHTRQGRVAIGWVLVEDLAMVVVLVLLPVLAGPLGGAAEAADAGGITSALALTLGKVAIFAVLMLVVGARVIPWLFRWVARTGSRELYVIGLLAASLGIAYGASVLFGVSFALGAFVAGLVVGQSESGHAAGERLAPLEDAFAALFFVSVGMLIDPAIFVTEPGRVVTVVAVVLLVKPAVAWALVLALKGNRHTAATAAASRGQIGEFSFILAGVGLSLGLLPAEGQALILAAAFVSIVLNPFLFRLADGLVARRGERLPAEQAPGV